MNLENVKYLPEKYLRVLEESAHIIISSFKDNLVNITLGGSGGKNEIIEGHSDLDLYVITKKTNVEQISNVLKRIDKLDIHVGITYYTSYQVKNKLIDNKTKIMIYEKRKLNLNPSIYGYFDYPSITYKEVVENDKNNLPNVNHVLIRECAYALKDKNKINTKYIKKMFVLIKCYLNTKNIFSYGYARSLKLFKEICNDNEIKNYKIDIEKCLKNISEYKEMVLDFSLKIIEYINRELEENNMSKRISSRGVIVEEGSIYTMFRRKKKDDGSVKEYYVIPGGGLEENETLEENVVRELKEEFGVDTRVLGYVGKRETDDTEEYYFACEITSGVPALGGEELERCTENNYYEVRKVSLDDIDGIDISGRDLIRKANNKEFTTLD